MFDLTQPLTPDIPRFPGDPPVRIEPNLDFAPWRVSALALGTHSGTHMDAPLHRIAGGAGMGANGPDRLVGHGLVIDASGYGENEAIQADRLRDVMERAWPGWFAMVRTGWDRYWGDALYFRHPYLSSSLAEALVEAGAGIVAIDALSIDSTADAGDRAHELLLGADVLVAENLCGLNALDAGRVYVVACLPLALGNVDGSPARVVAWGSELTETPTSA